MIRRLPFPMAGLSRLERWGDALPHNTMALVNVAYNISFGWTKPQSGSLEAQMREPLLNAHPVELGLAGREESVAAQLATDRSYAAGFAAAFPRDGTAVTFEHIVKAIASFERTLISGDSAFDRYVFGGDHAALSDQAKRGMALFFSREVGCSGCHSGIDFAGSWRDSQGETGKAAFADNGTSDRPMRVPTLRNLVLTAPYMHDGRFATLDAVLDHYLVIVTGCVDPADVTRATAVGVRSVIRKPLKVEELGPMVGRLLSEIAANRL